MARLQRFLLENHCYHVVTTTRDRQPIFAEPGFASLVVKANQFARRERAYVLAYAVMPDHFHGLFVPRDGLSISQVMHGIKGYTARLVNEKLRRRGPLWQRGFYDRIIRDERQLGETARYVEANAVLAGLAEEPAAYPYSSAGKADSVDWRVFV